MAELIRRADAGFLSVVDGVVLFWVVSWAAVAAWAGFSLWELADVGNTLVESGRTLDSAGEALQRAGEIPLIGHVPGQLGSQVRATAAEIIARGHETRMYGRQLGVLLALSVGLAPVVPVLIPYVPARLSRRREVAAVRRLLRDPRRRPSLEVYLAHRSVEMVPLHRLDRMTGDPWGDLAEGRVRALADAELTRLGIRGHESADAWGTG